MQHLDVRQLEAVVETVMQTLGDSVAGIYQYGSAVLGGLRPMSDLDLLVIVRRPTSHGERRRLTTDLMEVSGRRGTRIAERPVEVTVVRHDTVRPRTLPGKREFQYGEWRRDEYDAGFVPAPETDPDLAPLLATVLTASTALSGPRANAMIDPIRHEDLLASMRQSIPDLLIELDDDTCNVLLTLARMWRTSEQGDVVAKAVAAAWAVERMPTEFGEVLSHAGAVYLGETDAAFEQLAARLPLAADYLAAVILGAENE